MMVIVGWMKTAHVMRGGDESVESDHKQVPQLVGEEKTKAYKDRKREFGSRGLVAAREGRDYLMVFIIVSPNAHTSHFFQSKFGVT